MSDWISVNDEMPECGRIVLTREERSYRPPVAAILNRQGCFDGWSIIENDFIEGTGLKVTHWMLMPGDSEGVSDSSKKLEAIEALVNKQAEDEGLWFDATSATEAYLQRALRKLHAVIESES